MTDVCASPQLLSFNNALSLLLDNITPTEKVLTLNITQGISPALNYVLAEDLVSPVAVPPHNNSAMDGYAFALSSLENTIEGDEGKTLTLAGKSFAGDPFAGTCQAGECIRIMTGAKLPKGCDTVEMQENCRAVGTSITFTESKKLGQNIRKTGEDITIGQLVLKRGQRLGAVELGLIASLGIAEILVYQPIKVALIATGDELKTPGDVLSEGDIYESNRYFLSAMLRKLNVAVIDFGVISDDVEKIQQAFEDADKQADVVISSGGVSVGEADFTKQVLDSLGSISFWKLAMKPGKPFAFGQLKNSVFFGLPGNPVSALVTMYQLAVPGLVKLQNALPRKKLSFKVKTLNKLWKSPGRQDFQRGILSTNDKGELVVNTTGAQGSGILSSIGQANCFIVLAQEQGSVEAGEMVVVEPFDELIQLK